MTMTPRNQFIVRDPQGRLCGQFSAMAPATSCMLHNCTVSLVVYRGQPADFTERHRFACLSLKGRKELAAKAGWTITEYALTPVI